MAGGGSSLLLMDEADAALDEANQQLVGRHATCFTAPQFVRLQGVGSTAVGEGRSAEPTQPATTIRAGHLVVPRWCAAVCAQRQATSIKVPTMLPPPERRFDSRAALPAGGAPVRLHQPRQRRQRGPR